MLRPSELVAGLPALTPFTGPETLERRLGRSFELRLGANESPFGPSPIAISAMGEAAKNAQNYGDPEGWDLRLVIAQRHGVRVENVVLAGGIDELLALFCRAYGDPGSVTVTTLGSYPTFEYGAVGAGLEVARVPYRDDRLDVQSLLAHPARILYVANPDNPSGSCLSARELEALFAGLHDDTLLLLDEAYADFAPEPPPIDAALPNVVRLRTFSKAHGLAGMRVGYAIGHAETVGLLNRIRMHFGVGVVAQAGALAALRDEGFVAEVVRQTALGRERLGEIGRSLGLPPLPSATNFLLLDAGSRERAEAILQGLLARGVFVRKPSQPPLDRCVRITIGRPDQIDALEPILREAAR